MNSHRTATMTTKTAKSKTYELLLNKSGTATEQHYCAAEVEVSGIIYDFIFFFPGRHKLHVNQ